MRHTIGFAGIRLARARAGRVVRRLPGLLLLAAAATGAAAQSGGVEVTVLDRGGEPLPGATVVISHETGFVKTTGLTTDKRGVAAFPVLRPGAGYAVQVEFPGYSPTRQTDLRVQIGRVLRLQIQMIDQVKERVRVQAKRDVIDLETNESATKFSQEFISDLPVPGRFYQNVLTLAPGVQDVDGDGNPNVHGSRERDFSAMVGGVRNVDPLTGQWMSRINPNSIEEMEVITAGAGVEFGRAQGGFARIVQRQGSNEHEGVFELFYRTAKLDGLSAGVSGTSDDPVFDDPDYEWFQPAVQLSGPIIRDKLWYRLSHEQRRIEEPVNITTQIAVTETRAWTHSDQLTWQVSPRNKLAFHYQSDPNRQTNFGLSSIRPAEAAWDQERTGETYSLTWTSPVSPRVLVETVAAWQDLNLTRSPSTQGVRNNCVEGLDFLELSQCQNLSNANEYSGSFYRTEDDRSQRLTVSSKATAYSQLWGLNHTFKVGLSIENERYFRTLTQTPFGSFETTGSGPFQVSTYLARLSVPENDDVRATGTNWGVYFEDQIKPTTNMTLTLGLRVDQEELNGEGRSQFDPSAQLRAYEDALNPLIPLLLTGKDPDKNLFQVIASEVFPNTFTGFEAFGAFTLQMQRIICEGVPAETIGNCLEDVNANVLNQKNEDLKTVRRAEDLTITNTNFSPFLALAWSPGSDGKTALKIAAGRHYNNIPLIVPLQELEPALTELEYVENPLTGQLALSGGIQPTLTVRSVDRGIRTPYQDEFTVGFERELWAETSIGLTYINRQFRDQIQDININWAAGDYGNCILSFGGQSQVFPSIGSGQLLQDPFTGEVFQDTDPGPGDGRVDDCAGAEVPVTNGPGTVTRPDGFADLYVQNPFWGDIFLVGNNNEIDYEAFVVELIRRQYRSWEMQASYTWSRAEGDGEDFFQELGKDPSLRQNIQGFQSYDQRHVVKVNAATITPWGFRLGTALSWQSGLPYSVLIQSRSEDLLPPITDFTNLAGVTGRTRQTYATGTRNDQRNRSYWNIDLRAAKELRIGSSLSMQLSAEVFNVLDDDTYTVYNSFEKFGQQINGVNEAIRRLGRRWQLGLKIAW